MLVGRNLFKLSMAIFVDAIVHISHLEIQQTRDIYIYIHQTEEIFYVNGLHRIKKKIIFMDVCQKKVHRKHFNYM